ncbi:Endopolyphosphatase [Lophiostoma macrostomum CBS 122681]|uniref:Endopolyphosphatase n=1 Tax=Lophiostoma macrostomum CBS 122681 TaxID=1314788 RepID=A0A6A6TDH0_9PLEO|nr:Endopolyphosphatase [Lophiostoma macrostomum CBS 122681]
MLHARGGLAAALLTLLDACRAAPQSNSGTRPTAGTELKSLHGSRQLQGRFLHITGGSRHVLLTCGTEILTCALPDIHPDPFFKTYSSTEAEAACHRKRGPAGIYGAETSACDSPFSLVNETFKWIDEHLKDSIDFVIWTGDSARHDNDEKIPRTQRQVVEQNEFVVSKFKEVFGKGDNINDTDPTNDFTIPIVPTFGNNDILPHNIFLSGPNKWTYKFLDIWRNFIPEEQRHQFQQGGWFYQEVIPQKLAVLSLNTLYFFDSNSGVDGCANKHEPGYEHMEWLRVQLQILRERGMKVILIGHVPPARTDSKLSWEETCWQKFTLWERQYRDIIVGSLFGHMNIDHFMLQDSRDLRKDTKNGKMGSAMEFKRNDVPESSLENGEVTINSASDYLIDLRDSWAKLPTPPKSKKKSQSLAEYIDDEEEDQLSIWQWITSKLSKSKKNTKGRKGKDADKKKRKKKTFLDKIGGRYAERYSIAHVAPSVVPNYFPTLRIFTYNISTLEGLIVSAPAGSPPMLRDLSGAQTPLVDPGFMDFSDDRAWEEEVEEIIAQKKKQRRKERQSRKKPRKYKFKIPQEPDKSAPPGPAYSPQPFTLLGYTQYFANLTHINNDFVVSPSSGSEEPFQSEDGDDEVHEHKWKEGKHKQHQGKKPRPKPHPKKFKFEVEYDTRSDKKFKLKDLTVRGYVDLARRIGQDEAKAKFIELDVTDGEEDLEGDDAFEDESDDKDVEVESEDQDDEVDTEKKKKKKGKKHKHKHKHSKNDAWYTFVKRAFVGTMDPREIEETFGVRPEDSGERHVTMEL